MAALDRYGFDEAWFGEHHSGGYEIISCPEVFIAAAAQRTRTMLLEVPNGLPAYHAALTEPVAVGVHAVSRSAIQPGEGALVLGCGPVGLAVIAALRLRGIEPIVAADLSTARRELAVTMGAHEVVDPRAETGWAAWNRAGGGRPLVAYEAIGVPGILNDILRSALPGSRVLVVGVCMEDDTVTPFFGATKELSVLFSFGYTPEEFARTLGWIAEGEIDVAPMVTAGCRWRGPRGRSRPLVIRRSTARSSWSRSRARYRDRLRYGLRDPAHPLGRGVPG